MTGYPPERFTSSPEFWYAIVHPDDLPGLIAADVRADATFEPYLPEYRMRTAAGPLVSVRDEAIYVPAALDRPGHWIGLVVDITEQKRLESDLRSEAEKFRSLAEQIPAVVYHRGRGRLRRQPRLHQPEVRGAARVHARGATGRNRRSGASCSTPRTATACSWPKRAPPTTSPSARTTG